MRFLRRFLLVLGAADWLMALTDYALTGHGYALAPAVSGTLVLAWALFVMPRLSPRNRPAVTAPEPPRIARTPRDSRQGLDPADPANAYLLEVCPVCGMDDPERFALDIGTARWNGWPAHETCVAWLGGDRRRTASGVSYVPCRAESRPAAAFDICVPELAEAARRVIVQERGGRTARRPYMQPEPSSWRVSPAYGMTLDINGPGVRAIRTLAPSDPVHPRVDALCWLPDRRMAEVVTGTPRALPYAAMLPAGAEVIAWLKIPAGCTFVGQYMIETVR